jgi:SAM-dependent methyltransferase
MAMSGTNKREFFKDRHWLLREFIVLGQQEPLVCCELGCGVGNTTFPLLEENPNLAVFCSDFSATAVGLLRSDPRFEKNAHRIRACFVADCSVAEQVLVHVPAASCDVVLLVFVLSAMPLAAMQGVVASANSVLKVGGKVLVRDYATNDAAQLRFEQTPGSRLLEEGLFCRGDGTQAFFFRLEVLRNLWEAGGCFRTDQCEEKTAEPVVPGGHLRRFVQGVFVKI